MEDEMIKVIVPDECDPVFRDIIPCECALHPIKMTYKKGSIHWVAMGGEEVKEGQLIAEGNYEAKLIEFRAPADGELMIVLSEGEKIQKGDLLAYIIP